MRVVSSDHDQSVGLGRDLSSFANSLVKGDEVSEGIHCSRIVMGKIYPAAFNQQKEAICIGA